MCFAGLLCEAALERLHESVYENVADWKVCPVVKEGELPYLK